MRLAAKTQTFTSHSPTQFLKCHDVEAISTTVNMQCTVEHLLLVFKWTARNSKIHLGSTKPRFSFSVNLDDHVSLWLPGCCEVELLVSRKFNLHLRDFHDSWTVFLRSSMLTTTAKVFTSSSGHFQKDNTELLFTPHAMEL